MEWWIQTVREGGAIAAVLELGALVWLHVDRGRLIDQMKSKDEQLVHLSEKTITIMTELKTFLFNVRG